MNTPMIDGASTAVLARMFEVAGPRARRELLNQFSVASEDIVLDHDGTFNTLAGAGVDGYEDVSRTYGTFTGWEG